MLCCIDSLQIEKNSSQKGIGGMVVNQYIWLPKTDKGGSHAHFLQQLTRCTDVWKLRAQSVLQIMFSAFLMFLRLLLFVSTAELTISLNLKETVVEGGWNLNYIPTDGQDRLCSVSTHTSTPHFWMRLTVKFDIYCWFVRQLKVLPLQWSRPGNIDLITDLANCAPE